MKKILITGANSYIGMSVGKWLMKEPDKYKVDTVGTIDDTWKNSDFSVYDVVFHVAGIVHIKESKTNRSLYYKVNRDLAYGIAKKSKIDRVGQFIFLSTMSVYGIESGTITKDSPLNPKTAYGQSKLEGEGLINELKDKNFKVAILRPPMVYGKGCKGNYPRLARLARKTPIFPKIENKRSMIYIDNLSEFIKLLIDNRSAGLFFPQNKEYVNTSEMVKQIAETHGKKVFFTKIFNPLAKVLNIGIVKKTLGDLVYEMDMSDHEENYIVCMFKNSIEETESRKETST